MAAYGILRIPEWILKFAYVTLLWIVSSILGLFVLGCFPATAAVFAISRQWLLGNIDISITKKFFTYTKREFWRANLLGYLALLVGLTLYIYFQLIVGVDGWLFSVFGYLLVIISLLATLTCIYSFGLMVHIDLTIFTLIKHAFLLMIVSPLSSLMIISGLIILQFISSYSPAFLVIFGPGAAIFLFMFSVYFALLHVEKRREKPHVNTDR
ncbi:YesL family protein [Gracilibacillus phocaeensis]|uniref:YesL family protein n=1 Tax=Gracilibacillus phocaeensis TaxID=2042304 RepID=UPI0013EEFBFE|nr:DUF624 domain-containing protein [Gracilibacillus phocaeensis]